MHNAGYGEGIYVGNAHTETNYKFDCDYNTISHNVLGPGIAADCIDIKEGSTGTVVEYNILHGDGITGANSSTSHIYIRGSGVVVRYNVFYREQNRNLRAAIEVFSETQAVSKGLTSGQDNHVYGNTFHIDLDDQSVWHAANPTRPICAVGVWYGVAFWGENDVKDWLTVGSTSPLQAYNGGSLTSMPAGTYPPIDPDRVIGIIPNPPWLETSNDTGWTLEDGLLTIFTDAGMADWCENGTTAGNIFAVTEIMIEDGVTSIGNIAFFFCTNMVSVTIPDSVRTIGAGAFGQCHSLETITIPHSVTDIGEYPFFDSSSLTSIDVDSANMTYSSVDGVLFNKDQTLLIRYPIANPNHAYTIPNGVISIADLAFTYCENLTSITIPDSVTNIGWSAFSDCENLKEIRFLSDTEPTVGANAFLNVKSGAIAVVPPSWGYNNGDLWNGLIIRVAELHISVTEEDGDYWVEILNLTDKPISLRGLYIIDSDDDDDEERTLWQIPVNIIRGKQKILISGSHLPEMTWKQKRGQCAFDLSITENLYLMDAAGNVIS
ncbi:MAG: leucine-rich repeat domain-containing protein [Oscillospiraceae bacterium]|nr:leucine-rich repeat domain-containing protein [Oscillospiraceae bacterium]